MSIRNQIVADRYAQALMGLVGTDNTLLDKLDDEMDALIVILDRNPKVSAFLENPRILTKDKKELVRRTLGDRLSPPVLHVILLLIDKHRESELRGIAERFSHLADLRRGVQEAEVISAIPLPKAQLERLTSLVQRFSEHEVKLVTRVDPDLIGGVVLKMGHRVVDGSVRYKLQELRRALLNTTVH